MAPKSVTIGQKGECIIGERGPAGPQGDPGLTPPTIKSWHVDREHFVVTPILAGGDAGPPIDLRPLFESYHNQVTERGHE